LLVLIGAWGAPLACAQGPGLEPYTRCEFGPQFQTAQVDGPIEKFAWATQVKSGEVSIAVETGYRMLVTYLFTEPFGNLKVEQLPSNSYEKAKSDLLSSLEYFASQSGMDGKVQSVQRDGLALYGVNRSKLEGGVLSIYNLFSDRDHVAVTMYLLNAEPADRKFDTMEKYATVRDEFLQKYTSCLQQNLKNRASIK
jgi:hypothetical protein